MQLGYLTHVAGHGSPAAIYRDTVALAMAAEELGLDAFWVASTITARSRACCLAATCCSLPSQNARR